MRTISADWLRGRRWLLAGLACLAARACDGFAVFVVPADMRAQGAREIEHRTRFVSLDSVFPEAGGRLCDRWAEDDQLRSAVRAAGREDFYEDDPRFDEKRLRALRAIARDPATSLQGRWRRERPFPALTSALAANANAGGLPFDPVEEPPEPPMQHLYNWGEDEQRIWPTLVLS